MKILNLSPIFFLILLIIWAKLVSPYSKYGDAWAIYPAILIFFLIIISHIALICTEKAKLPFIIYALIHGMVAFYFLIYSLTLISKDSL